MPFPGTVGAGKAGAVNPLVDENGVAAISLVQAGPQAPLYPVGRSHT